MKKHLKRALSMILAMLMVMGTLPMDVFALEMFDSADSEGRVEIPVLDDGDSAGLRSDLSFSGEEQPEIPVDPQPSEDPGELDWTNTGVSSLTVNEDGSWEITIATDASDGSSTGTWVLALVPEATANGKTTTPSKLWASGGIGSTRDNENSMTNAINGATGLVRNDHFIVVSGNVIYSSGNTFTIKSNSPEITTTQNTTLPTANELVTALGVTAPIEIRAFFYCKGSDTKVVSGTTQYGEASKGLPHTVYMLNKTEGTLIYVGGTLEGTEWAPGGVTAGDVLVGEGAVGSTFGTWDGDYNSLAIPIYNVTGEELTSVVYPGPTLPDGVTTSGLPTMIDQDGQGTATFSIPDSVESGTITVPITGTGADGVYTGSITVYVDAGMIPVTADPIDFYITKGDKSMETTPMEQTVTFHYPATYSTWSDEGGEEGTGGFVMITDPVMAVVAAEEGETQDEIYGLLWGDPTYSLTADYGITDFGDDGMALDITKTFKVVLGAYDEAFDAVTTDGEVLEGSLTIVGLLDMMSGYYVSGPEEVVIPIRIHVTVPNEEEYTVKFDTNVDGRDLTPNPSSVSDQGPAPAGTAVDLTATLTDTKGHYQFEGWAKAGGGVMTSYDIDAADADASGVITLYAVWSELKYNVVYANAAASTYPQIASLPATVKYMKDAEVTVDTTAVADAKNDTTGLYYSFAGWEITTPATGTSITSGKFDMPGEAVTLTATWTPVNVTVTYALNGGTAGTAAGTNTVQKGDDYTIDADNPTKSGYSFKGWKLTAGTGTAASDTMKKGDTVADVTTNIILTAQWGADDTNAIFDLNATDAKWKDNNTGTYTDSGTAGDPATPPEAKMNPVREHYTFKGWNTDKDAAAVLTAANVVRPAIGGDDITYYAIWTPDTYTVTYDWGLHTPVDDNGAIAVPTGGPLTYVDGGASYDVEESPAANDNFVDANGLGWTFLGWSLTRNTTADGDVAPGDTIENITTNITLTAKWAARNYTVTYQWDDKGAMKNTDGDAVTLAGTPTSVQHGDDFASASNLTTTDTYVDSTGLGWTLAGWAVTGGAAENGTTITQGDDVTDASGNITLTAVWAKKEFDITFNKNGGTFDDGTAGATIVRKVQYGAAAGAAPGVSKTDYSLIDWNTKSSAAATDGTVFSATDKVYKAETYYARWLGDTADIVVTVTKDGDPWKDQTVSLKNESYTPTENPDGTYTFSALPVGTYTVVVNNREVKTVTISKTTDGEAEAKFWTVTAAVATAGTGNVAAGASANPAVGTAGTSVVVYNGEMAYVNASPATDYKFSTWSDNVSGTATTAANSVANVTDTTTVTATFVKKTGSIVVAAKLNITGTAHTFPNGTVVTLVPHGATLGADTSKEKTQTVGNTTTGSVTFANLEHDSTNGWDIYVGTTKIADGDNVKVTGNDGSSVTKNAMYYTVEVKTGGHGDASVTDGTTTKATNYAATPAVTENSFVVLEQTQVTWAVGTAETDYAFQNWDGTETNATAYQNVSITAKTSHTANFNKVSFTVQAVVNLNKEAQDGDAVGTGMDIVSITAVKTDGNKPDPANLTFTYNDTTSKWVLSGLPTGNTYKVVVTTSTGPFDIATGITQDKSDVSGSFFSVETVKTDYEDTQAVMAVTTPAVTGQTKVVVKSGTAIGLTVDASDGYDHTGWTETNTSNKVSSNSFTPTDVTTAGTGITLTPTFTYTAIIKPTRDGGIYDLPANSLVVKTGSTTVGTATEQADHTWKVSGLTIDTDYDIWINGYLSDKDTNGINEVEVPIWFLTTADDPTGKAATRTVKGVTSILMPNGAGEADMALVAAASGGYRLRAATETPATWTSSDAIAAVATDMSKVTVTNITKDVTLTVNLVQQWTVDVVNGNKDAGTLTLPVVSAGGTVATVDSTGSYKGNLVDDKGTITVGVTPVAGWTPTWTVKDSDGNAIEGKTVPADGVVTVDQDMTIEVTWEATKYDVEVTINLDNEAKTDIENTDPDNPILYLKKGSELTPLTHTSNGVYTAKVVPGNYAIWSPVASDGGATAQNTGRAINFNIAQGEADGPELKATLNYYKVTIAKSFSDGGTPGDIFAGHGTSIPANTTAETAAKERIVLAGHGTDTVTVKIAATTNNRGGSGPYYNFDQWSGSTGVPNVGVGDYTMPGENTWIADGKGDNGITLTAEYQRQFKVTLGAAKKAATATVATDPAGVVDAKFAGTAVSTSGTVKSVYVDAGDPVAITDLGFAATDGGSYKFVEWKQDQTGETAGTWDPNAQQEGPSFTPKADTTLQPTYLRKPTMTAVVDKHHLNYNETQNVPTAPWNNTKNNLPKYTWTGYDATIGDICITAGGTESVLPTTAYTKTEASGVTTIVFDRTYLEGLVGSKDGTGYTITVKSKTGGEVTDLDKPMTLYVTPDQLLTTTIKVNANKPGVTPDTPYETLNLKEGATDAGRKTAIYDTHTPTSIIKENKLTFTWYYGDKYPAPESIADGANAAAIVANRVTTAGGHALVQTTDAVWTDVFAGGVAPNADLVKDELKGKWIYATVKAEVTGKGWAITNAIAVDYDAAIRVRQNNNAITSNGDDNDQYSIYLVPKEANQPATIAKAGLAGAGAVEAPYVSGNLFQTADSALTGGKTYVVYANRVQGDDSTYVKTDLEISTQVNAANTDKFVDFYTVHAANTAKKDAVDSLNQEVGEAFTGDNALTTIDLKAADAAGAFNLTVDSGKGVLKGSAIKATTTKDTWIQDYNVNWAHNTGTAANLTNSYGTQNQTASKAHTDGYTSANNVIAQTWIGAQLKQNVYTVIGKIWDQGGSTGGAGIKTGNDNATLSFENGDKTYVFRASGSGSTHTQSVEFVTVKLPRSSSAEGSAITGKYTLAAKPLDMTTILALKEGAAMNQSAVDAAAVLDGDDENILKVDVDSTNSGTATSLFTIVVEKSNGVLEVKDKDTGDTVAAAKAERTHLAATAPTGNGIGVASVAWTDTYAYTAGQGYTVVLTNKGNTSLDVALDIKKAADAAQNGYVFGAKSEAAGNTATVLTQTTADGLITGTDGLNNVVFGKLKKSFTLAPNESIEFTVTIPVGLAVDKTADYDFEFTSKLNGDATKYGPSVTYKLTQEVTPRKVTAVAASASGNTLTASDLKIDNATPPAGVTVNETNTTGGDVVYEWYAVDYNSTVALNANGVLTAGGTAKTPVGSGKTYTKTAADAGKDMYVVARGVGMSGNVLSAARSDVITLPYDLDIIVKENDDPVSAAKKDNYKVYLWDKDTAFDPLTAIEAVKTAADDGAYTATDLVPGKTYKIYTNAVGGTTNANWQNSTETAALTNFTGNDKPEVIYRDVIINNTATVNSPFSFTDSDANFLNDTSASKSIDQTNLVKPTAKKGATDVATSEVNKWVQRGTEITLTYADWDRDYKLDWLTAASGTVATDPANDVTTTVTVTGEETTIDTTLTLNIYDVEAWVVGKGTVDEITLEGNNGLKLTSTADHDGFITGISGGAQASISNDAFVTFKVPKGEYTAKSDEPSGVDLVGYRQPHQETAVPDTGDTTPPTIQVTNAKKTFDVMIKTSGRGLKVSDNASIIDTTASDLSGSAWYRDKHYDATINQTITLPYGYDTATLTLNVEPGNVSDSDYIYDVDLDISGVESTTGKFTATKPAAPAILLDGSANMRNGEKTAATVEIAAGLDVNTTGYASTLVFSFHNADGDTTAVAKVTYNLTVVVEPAKFTNVTITKATASEDIGDGTMVPLGEDLKPYQYTTAATNLWEDKGITKTTDYKYFWYATPANQRLEGTWANGVFTPKTGVTATPLTAEADYTLKGATIAEHPGQKIWLVVSAENGKNVEDAAISNPVTTGYQPVLKVTEDGADVDTEEKATGYVVQFIDSADATKTYAGVWDDDAKGFVPTQADGTKISLSGTTSLTAKVSPAKGITDAAKLAELDDVTLTLADPEGIAPYFTVNAVETRAFEGVTGLGEAFGGDADALPGMAFALGADAIADKPPVLKGQNVTAKATTEWSQDYDLTWYTATGTTQPDPDTNAYEKPATGNQTMAATSATNQPSGTSSGAAGAAGASGNVEVKGKTWIGGRLDQNTYTITGTVHGTPGTVAKVTLTQTDGAKPTYVYPDDNSSPKAPTSDSTASDGSLKDGNTVTFTVVAGTFNITPTEGAATIIKSMAWENETAVDGTITLKDKTVTAGGKVPYTFDINIEGANIKLKVEDDATTAAESTPTQWNSDTNELVRYFHAIDKSNTNSTTPDKDVYTLTLSNAGNKPLKMDVEVYHFDTAPTIGTTATAWDNVKVNGTEVYNTTDGTGAKDFTAVDDEDRVILSVSDMIAKDTALAAKDVTSGDPGKIANAGKITLGKGAWAKDSGVYVFHFMGVTDDTDKTPVDVYYVLDLTVNQLPIVGVASSRDGVTDMVGVGETITVKGYDADNDQSLANVTVQLSGTTSDKGTALANALTDNDVHFAWVSVPKGTTAPVPDDFTVKNDGTLSAKTGITILEQNAKTYTVTAPDVDIYLVAYAPNSDDTKTNADKLAVSNPIPVKRTVEIQVSLDGVIQPALGTDQPFAADGLVNLYLVETTWDGDTTKADNGTDGVWSTTWNGATKGYKVAIDAEKVYKIYAPTYQGSSTYVDTGLTVGKNVTDKRIVPYWGVKFAENVEVDNTRDGYKSYLPGGTVGSANAIQKGLSVKVSTDKTAAAFEAAALTATDNNTVNYVTSIPVLDGMSIQVTVDGTKKNNNATTKEAWADKGDYHTLNTANWANAAGASTKITYPAADGQVVSNAITVNEANIKDKTISATLKQVLFNVTFGVVDVSDPHNTDTKIRAATLKPDTTKETGVGATPYTWSFSNATGVGDGGTVTFTDVPAGSFVVKADDNAVAQTMVKGYTWGDAADVKTKGDIVTVTTNSTKNEDDTNNTIQILKATSMIMWFDNFDPTDGSAMVDENGAPVFPTADAENTWNFHKLDKRTVGPDLALLQGYSAPGDTLTYHVRVQNVGTAPLVNFKLTPDSNALNNLSFDLTSVSCYGLDEDGNKTNERTGNATTGVTLRAQEYVEFTVTIKDAKNAQDAPYEAMFSAICDEGTPGGGAYEPNYQVKAKAQFAEGGAQVIYGDKIFKSHHDVTLSWKDKDGGAVTGYTGPTFHYDFVELETLTGNPGDAAYDEAKARNDAKLAEINTQMGLSLTDLDAKPGWLSVNNTSGEVSITAAANTVNVQVKEVDGKLPADFDQYDANPAYHVNDELTLYVRITNDKGDVIIVPYVVDVEPGQLVIDGTPTFSDLDAEGGSKVDLSKFIYDKVTNDAKGSDGNPDRAAIVPEAVTPNVNTAAGNDPDNAGNGQVFVNGIHTVTWTVANPSGGDTYVTGNGVEYTFTVTYMPMPKDNAQKWNYKPATSKQTIDATAPPIGLKFSDKRTNATDVDDANATIITKDPDKTLSGANGDDLSEVKLVDEAVNVTRAGEKIVYLDQVPTYTVNLDSVGEAVYDLTLTATTTVENAGDYGGFSFTHKKGALQPEGGFKMTDEDYVFELTPDKLGTRLYAGTYHVKFTATGYSTDVKAEQTDANKVEATYEITFVIAPRPITKADVTELDKPELDDPKLDDQVKVKPTLDGDDDPTNPLLKPDGTDTNGITPVTPKIEWTPKNEPVTADDYTVTITLKPDPNYVFVDEVKPDPGDPDKEPNYTLDSKGDKEWPEDKNDPELTVEKEQDGTVVYEKPFTVVLPGYLTYEDQRIGAETDKVGPNGKDAPDGKEYPEVKRTIRVQTKATLGQYYVDLKAADHDVYDVVVTGMTETGTLTGWKLDPEVTYPEDVAETLVYDLTGNTYHRHTLDLSGINTEKPGNLTLTFTAEGYSGEDARATGKRDVGVTYVLELVVNSPGGGGGTVTPACPHQVSYLLGLYGTTTDATMEMVADKAKIKQEPTVTPVEGWKFLGWSMTAPTGKADQDAKRELVVPKDVSITADTNFYAVYAPAYELGRPFHEHYVIGYPNGNFGPADNINRASVATIIARAVLPNFVEGADYGNPGGYTDVSGHWAASAIAYCSKYGVFKGYEDGTFRPDQSITRQEFALVIARLDGVLTAGNMPFSDIGEAGDWALGGIYTAYIKGWVNGYEDGSFKPLNYIRRDEAVKVFNAYLYRGVNAEGLSDLKEYVHSGVASNNHENGTDEYMTWPDVPKDHWAYYEIIEAANDHEYTVDTTQPKGYTVPEHWDKCWIDEKWRYHDDLNDGGPTVGLVTAGFRIWTEA